MSMWRVPRVAASAVAVSGVWAGVMVALRAPVTWGATAGGVTWGVRLDALSSVLLVFVGFLTWLVAGYARTNLDGQKRLARFCLTFLIVVFSLALMVAGSNLVLVAAGWTASGWGIASLIGHPQTVAARRASRFVRGHLLLSDLALWSGVVIAAVALPTIDRGALQAASPAVTLVVALLVLAGTVRSSLFPFHRWLPETAEAPSPVSALLHAGLVNGAGIIALICWPLYRAAPVALGAMVLIGLCSVVAGTLNGRVRTDVKGQLACSTTAQMGYMTLQIGLGLPAAGLLHLLGHGCYKAWLFLRAGGAVSRGRVVLGSPVAPRAAGVGGGVAATCIAVLVGLPAIWLQTSGVMGLLPGALALAVAAAAGSSIATQRAAAVTRALIVVAAGVVAGGYLWLLVGWEHLFADTLASDAIWTGWVAVLLLAAVIGLGWLTARLAAGISRSPSGVLSTVLNGTGLPPWSRRIGGHLPSDSSGVSSNSATKPLGADVVKTLVSTAGAISSPAWPLRELVAANPLAGLTVLPFDDAVAIMEGVHGTRLHLPLASYLDLFDGGRITEQSLASALAEQPSSAAGHPVGDVDAGTFLRRCREMAGEGTSTPAASLPHRFSDEAARHRRWGAGAVPLSEVVNDHDAWWTQRAWARLGDVTTGPWKLWRVAASRPVYDRVIGVRGASAWVTQLPQEPAAAIGELLRRTGVESDAALGYVCALLASGPGWASHAQWRSRQHDTPAPLLELVALRMAFDVLAARSTGAETLERSAPAPASVTTWRPDRIWQRAWEIGIHQRVLTPVAQRAHVEPAPSGPVGADMVFCIDVRSERLRRFLEEDATIRTHGFAGFFGAAIRVEGATGVGFDQCPALVRPSAVVRTATVPLTGRQLAHRGVTAATSTPLLALLVAEGAGALSGVASLTSALLPTQWRSLSDRWVRGGSAWGQVTHLALSDADVGGCSAPGRTLEDRVGIAAGLLRTIGLADGFAPLLVICGHEAGVANNAFAAAYDCGACGGNSGRVNAQVVAALLNEPAVRQGLADQGINVPDRTLAIAAVHNTTTDALELDALSSGWRTHRMELESLQGHALLAGRSAAAQRITLLPARAGDRRARRAQDNASRRSADWSEPMPEWGLAGNVAMVVGPRRITAGLDLAGRVFLQSYEAALDTPDHAILEQILTAPVVVGQWINAQYYFSTIAPDLLGAGDKTTHNVVGDVGVITGSHGDLRTGLPWQSLSPADLASEPLSALHEPARLLVVVAAAPDAVAAVLLRQAELYGLLVNRWLRIVCLTDAHPTPVEMHPDLVARHATEAPSHIAEAEPSAAPTSSVAATPGR